MLHVLAQHDVEVAWSGDQKVVEAFPSQCPDEPFGDRVGPGCSYRGADDADVLALDASVAPAGFSRAIRSARVRIGVRWWSV